MFYQRSVLFLLCEGLVLWVLVEANVRVLEMFVLWTKPVRFALERENNFVVVLEV